VNPSHPRPQSMDRVAGATTSITGGVKLAVNVARAPGQLPARQVACTLHPQLFVRSCKGVRHAVVEPLRLTSCELSTLQQYSNKAACRSVFNGRAPQHASQEPGHACQSRKLVPWRLRARCGCGLGASRWHSEAACQQSRMGQKCPDEVFEGHSRWAEKQPVSNLHSRYFEWEKLTVAAAAQGPGTECFRGD
jgi:hypothetical protein